jgi:hypothetical protein
MNLERQIQIAELLKQETKIRIKRQQLEKEERKELMQKALEKYKQGVMKE